MLYYTETALSPFEVPGESAICIYISGCPNRCISCHYPELQQDDYGDVLSENFPDIIDLYLHQATCVCFLGEGKGGREERAELLEYAAYAKAKGLKSCLYCGRNIQKEDWMNAFDYIKLGSYQEKSGALDSPSTNQRMLKRTGRTFIDITKAFLENQ